MATVALIGPDGAGKTTLTKMLMESGTLPFRYLYMGVDISKSNVALPTSRLVDGLKRRFGQGHEPGAPEPAGRGASNPLARRFLRSSRAALRLTNRIAEECYRQLVSWSYQLRGFVVLYDRHFIFDFSPEIQAPMEDSLERRLHWRFLDGLYPRPDLVLFLDAPGEVLFARKGESTVAELERRRQAFLRHGRTLANFVTVDATRPLDEVYDEIMIHIHRLQGVGAVEVAREAG